MGSAATPGAAVTGDGHIKIPLTDATLSEPLYFVDTSGIINPWYESYICGIYQRDTNAILGEDESDQGNDELESANRCFNCGSPDHSVSACPLPRNKELISLSRQYHNFYRELRGIIDHPRIYLAEGWRQQRLEWLDILRPGHIQNPLLQEAIGFGDGDWLKNIAAWGYPPGWISVQDPREKVRLRIWDEYLDDGYERPGNSFRIFGETDEPEDVSKNTLRGTERSSVDLESQTSSNAVHESIRWAVYPSTYFSSDLLFAYTHREDPSLSSIDRSAAFDGEDDYFFQIYGQPPPPAEDPPPIPPPPSSLPLPTTLLPSSPKASKVTVALPSIKSPLECTGILPIKHSYSSIFSQEYEQDMDISDSE